MSASVDQQALVRSQAGMRFIAQTTLYNAGQWERLAGYIADHYTATALIEQPAEARLAAFQALHAQIGRLHVLQVLATDPHQVVVVVEEEGAPGMSGSAEAAPGTSLIDLVVEADYPHRILAYDRAPIEVNWVQE